jgi:predicted nucleotidyltransferase
MIASTEIGNVVHRIADHFDPEKIILFGSYAHGQATEQSDLDLLVVASTNLPVRDRFRTIRRLLADFPIAFDVYLKTPEEFERWRSVVNHVVYYADKYGKVVYERSGAGSGSPVVVEGASGLEHGVDTVVAPG